MEFPAPLIPGRLLRRYERFLADVVIAGPDGGHREVTAHCADPGAMLGLATPDSDVWLSLAHNPKRKLKFTWELIRVHTHLVGINTSLPNTLASEAIAAGNIPELTGYESARREVRYGENSRIDILLESPDKPTLLCRNQERAFEARHHSRPRVGRISRQRHHTWRQTSPRAGSGGVRPGAVR